MVALPLFGVWLASSLAAFANRATWQPVAAGLLLFPGLPLLWEGAAALRRHGDRVGRVRRRVLTFGDRLVLRTLAVNALFLVVLLAMFPQRAFLALSTRGDWMLDGRHGASAERARTILLTSAGTVEWLYKWTNDNPYRKDKPDDRADQEQPKPVPTATTSATPVPPPVPTTSSSGSPPPPPPVDDRPPPLVRYPLPATLHPLVTHIPPEAEASIETLGKYIAAHETDPVQRVKALHDWVADRVAYDTASYNAHHIPQADGDAKTVFHSHIGVCAGYAALLAELGKVTGDEIVYLVGDARSQEAPMEGEPHAWNAVKIAGSWYLMDPTWDAGTGGDEFHKKYSTAYLFAPPSVFGISHFPDQPKWQLLEQPLSRGEFFRRPVLAPAFFANGLELQSPSQSQVSVTSSLEATLGNPQHVFILADFTPKAGGPKVDCKTNEHTTVRCDFHSPGTYDVKLYANHDRYGTYGYVGALQVNARP